jgi:hypothetical protein
MSLVGYSLSSIEWSRVQVPAGNKYSSLFVGTLVKIIKEALTYFANCSLDCKCLLVINIQAYNTEVPVMIFEDKA